MRCGAATGRWRAAGAAWCAAVVVAGAAPVIREVAHEAASAPERSRAPALRSRLPNLVVERSPAAGERLVVSWTLSEAVPPGALEWVLEWRRGDASGTLRRKADRRVTGPRITVFELPPAPRALSTWRLRLLAGGRECAAQASPEWQ